MYTVVCELDLELRKKITSAVRFRISPKMKTTEYTATNTWSDFGNVSFVQFDIAVLRIYLLDYSSVACNDRETNGCVMIVNATISCLTIFAPRRDLGYLQLFSRVLQECSCLSAWEIQKYLRINLSSYSKCLETSEILKVR